MSNQGFREADHIVEGEYRMSPIEQAPMETCGAIAAPETNDRYVCHTSTQALFFSLGTTAKLLDMPLLAAAFHRRHRRRRVRRQGRQHRGADGRARRAADRPAGQVHVGSRGGDAGRRTARAEMWRIRDGVARDGRILARQFTGFFDSGAYTRLSSYAIIKGTGHLPGPYTIPNVASNVYCVFTQPDPATAMRASASPASISPSSARWTGWRRRRASTRSSCASSTPIATAT